MAQLGYTEKLPPFVQETEQDAAVPATLTQKPRRFWDKLGFYNIAVLFFGTIAIFLALAFLFFIWGASTHGRQSSFPELWHAIVVNKWATRVVTLSSVLIRIATAAQLGVFAAILAALILEQVGVSTEDLPLVSMIRCLNSGPHSLALSVANSIFSKALWPYSFLIFLAILNAFALQFTSTVLLTDFGDTLVVMEVHKENIAFGLNRDVASSVANGQKASQPDVYQGLDYWKTGPSAYQRFAEYKEKGAEGEQYVDTGRTLRGFPPFPDYDNRTTLRHYGGPMMVSDTRVVCIQPTVSNVTVYNNDKYATSFNGSLSWKSTSFLKMDPADEGREIKVNCSVPLADYYDLKKDWQLSMCRLGPGWGHLNNVIRNDVDVDNPNGNTNALLLLNATGDYNDWQRIFPDKTKFMDPGTSAKASWTRMASNNVSIDFTLCFLNPQPWTYEVEATSDVNGDDRYVLWDSSINEFETSDILDMYGATPKPRTPTQRRQLELKNKSNWTSSGADQVWNITTEPFIWDTLTRFDYIAWANPDPNVSDGVGETTMFTPRADAQYSVHRTHAAVFQDIMQKNGNPAVAVQTMFTILLQMAYYDFLSEYDVSAPAKWQMSTVLNIPNQWKAFGAVLGLLGLHAALIFTAVRMFLTRTEMSLLGNAWQAVSQVVSTDTADVLHNGATTTDREVKGAIRQNGIGDSRIRLVRSVTNGRTEATAVRQRHGATYSTPVGQA
jgi:hypothetical protein